MTLPETLLPTAISLVLGHIVPPSLLAPLPPHLISNPLAQRHRFLNISPHQPAQYLAWPSDSNPNAQQSAVDLLEDPSNLPHHPQYTVRYTSDPESSFAHAAISTHHPPALRLVFQWASDGWKFHNLALMPFPPNSYESIQEIITHRPLDFLDEPSVPDDDDERDAYWDAYGLGDDIDDHTGIKHFKPEHEPATEDAYWARYSSVHGSGDSTRPTPPTVNQKLDNERVILSYPHHCTSSAYNPLAPPSPKALASLLANLLQRAPLPPPLDDSDSGFGSASTSDGSTSYPVSPSFHASDIVSSPDASSALLSVATYTPSLQTPDEHDFTRDHEARHALKDTIRGVYCLWKTGRVIDSPAVDGDREEFLEIVRQALIH
ncbi:hypothetical protein C0991_000159 [Blastosporella zonata]|nr:hypothetical protein C0991_000159 [Blastosporella zonata]